ncbi:MAG: PilZ domain-containing protein [Bryobacteraceae bacterium]|nr:PilZ domain-containing protein [Bryobacteraceae bacterium]
MERRSEPRYSARGPAEVTLLADNPVSLRGRIVNLSGRGMRIWLPEVVPVGAPVRVDYEGAVFLGEICYCNAEEDGYSAGFQLEHVVSMSDELAALIRALEQTTQAPVSKRLEEGSER